MQIINTPNFQAWFSRSRCTDTRSAGATPLVVYHGTSELFTAFDTSSAEGGAFFTTNEEAAEDYGDLVIPVYLRILRPKIVSARAWARGTVIDRGTAVARGYDGYCIKDHDISGAEGEDTICPAVGDTWIAFRPEQIKCAQNNSGAFDPGNPAYCC